jgi:hypothetical protein
MDSKQTNKKDVANVEVANVEFKKKLFLLA